MIAESNGKVTLIAVGDVGPIWEPVEPLIELAMPVLEQGDLRFGQCERVYSEELANEKRVPKSPGVLHPRLASVYTAGGFNVVSLASKHSLDGRELGVLHNLETFNKVQGRGRLTACDLDGKVQGGGQLDGFTKSRYRWD